MSARRLGLTGGEERPAGFESPLVVTAGEKESFWRDGYVLCEGMLADKELQLLDEAARNDSTLKKHAFAVDDGEGGKSALTLWNYPGDDTYGAVMRSHRIVESAEYLLGGEVYHYHTKLMRKDPFTGGAFVWHQDYGYWYQNGILFPDLVTVFIALDDCTPSNGCLQVLRGSHRMGRLEHGRVGGQTGIHDLERVATAERVMDHVYVEMKAGDALFFHSNTLHRSDKNESAQPRWALLAAYNLASNNPYKEHHHPRYTKLNKLPDSAIEEMGVSQATDSSLFMDPEQDATSDGKKDD